MEICEGDLMYANQTIDDLKSSLAKQESSVEHGKRFLLFKFQQF